MKTKNIIIYLVLIFVIAAIGYLVLESEETMDIDENGVVEEDLIDGQDEEDVEDDEEDIEKEEQLKDIATQFIGAPHESGPMGEDEENIFRTDAFDSTTLILVTATLLNYPEDPEEGIKGINYYPPGEVSYQNRLHFSSYRNKVSDYFEDITSEVAAGNDEEKVVVLNKERDGERLIDIDWEEEVILRSIPKDKVEDLISRLPEVAGVLFISEGDEDMGLDVRYEGIVLDNEMLIHSSSKEGEVVSEDFLSFLEDSNYDSVNFFKFK